MFRGDVLVKPKMASVFCALAVGLIAYGGSQLSPVIGYCLAMLTLVVLFAQAFWNFPVWPRVKASENIYTFSLYWGLIVGLVIPFLIEIVIDEGFSGIYELVVT